MDANSNVHNALQLIHDVVLKVVSVTYPMDLHAYFHMQVMNMECYNVSGELDDDDLWNIKVLETEGIRDVSALDVPTDPMNQPLKIKKVNIRTEENPKFANVGDYWDEEMMEKITDLLHEFQDLFPTKFIEMKEILGDLREMKIPLKPDTKPVRQRLYHLNPQYKERVKMSLIRCWMLE